MSDLIKREDAIKAVLGLTMYKGCVPVDSVIFNIKKIPTANADRKTDIAESYLRGWNNALDAVKNGKFVLKDSSEKPNKSDIPTSSTVSKMEQVEDEPQTERKER